jgi:hypothetical protein
VFHSFLILMITSESIPKTNKALDVSRSLTGWSMNLWMLTPMSRACTVRMSGLSSRDGLAHNSVRKASRIPVARPAEPAVVCICEASMLRQMSTQRSPLQSTQLPGSGHGHGGSDAQCELARASGTELRA